jgi:hypothetical protein
MHRVTGLTLGGSPSQLVCPAPRAAVPDSTNGRVGCAASHRTSVTRERRPDLRQDSFLFQDLRCPLATAHHVRGLMIDDEDQ